MTHRLQVLLKDDEYRAVRRAARTARVSVAQWVWTALKSARPAQPSGDVDRKLEVIRRAARHEFPTGDIDQMLAEIERGYLER